MASVALGGFGSQNSEENENAECKSSQSIGDVKIKVRDGSLKEIAFPGPCEIRNNLSLGNYVVASRRIQEGELIFKEKALFVAPYTEGPFLPRCISCFKYIALSNKCSECKWPVCDSSCEKVSSHANNECKIFSANDICPEGNTNEYFCIEVLRCLLARNRFPERWVEVLKLESHTEARKQDVKALEKLDITKDFIRNKCKLTEFDEKTIDRVVGVLSINPFWAFRDVNRYATILFPKTSLMAHECNPNTTRVIVLRELTEEETKAEEHGYEIEIRAKKTIEKGEMISIHYGDMSKPVKERRATLKQLFYFDCFCERCLVELKEEESKL